MDSRGTKRPADAGFEYDRPTRRARDDRSRTRQGGAPQQKDPTSRLLKLRHHIIHLADKLPGQEPPNVDEQLELLAKAIARDLKEFDEEQFKAPLLEVVMSGAEELPSKTSFYGCLVGLLNSMNAPFCQGVVDATMTSLQAALDKGDCIRLRMAMRFLACLCACNVASSGAVVACFKSLVAAATAALDEDTGNPLWQSCGDHYIFCILAALPFCGLELHKVARMALEELVSSVRAYMNTRTKLAEPALQAFDQTPEGKSTTELEDFLEDLWSRVSRLIEDKWELKAVPRPQAVFFDNYLSKGEAHNVQSLAIPPLPHPPDDTSAISMDRERHKALQAYPPARARLEIFPSEKAAAEMSPIDQFLVEEYLHDILFHLNGARKECASYLVALPVPFRYDYLMAEAIFGEMLYLPHSPFRLIYYTVVLVDLCKALPNTFPSVVAGAIRSLFERVPHLDIECRARFELWLAHHLSNFGFVWPWSEWAEVLELPAWAPQRAFCHQVLEREVRLSYWDKIKGTVPDRFLQLLPPKPMPHFKYGLPAEQGGLDPKAPEVELSNELVTLIRSKKTTKEVLRWLDERVIPAHGLQQAVDIFATTVLQVGSKTFTHIVTMLERYQPVFTRLVPSSDQAEQVALVSLVASFWRNSSQMTAVVIDRMMGLRIVSNLAIIDWVFSPEAAATFHVTGLVWEVLGNAMDKTNNRVLDLHKSLAELQVAAAKASAAVVAAEGVAEGGENRVEAAGPGQSEVAALKDEEEAAVDAVAAKQALLARAVAEQESLLLRVFSRLTTLVSERLVQLDAAEQEAKERAAASGATTEDADMNEAEAGDSGDRRRRATDVSAELSEEEEEARQWVACVLKHMQAIARHYAPQVWSLMEKLEEHVLTGKVDVRIRKAAFSGLQRTYGFGQ